MPSTQILAATRGATMRAVLLVLVGSIGVQTSSALAYGLFGSIGAIGTSTLRFAIAAVLVVAIFRPRLRGRTGEEWVSIVLYGVAMAASNVLLYLAIDRIPLGIATTIDFLGPCMVALFASRRLREGLLAFLAFVGVALIAGLGGPLDPLGLVFAALAGSAFALYTLLAARVGKSAGGLQNMALSVVVAAVVSLPFAVPAVPRIEPAHWLPLVLSALLGTALAFTVDTMAGRLTSARVIGVLFAFDPVIGTMIGALWLGQDLSAPAVIGIGLVVVAGAGIVWFAGQRVPGSAPRREASGQDPVESIEVERKYEVSGDARLPTADAFAALGLQLSGESVIDLEAHYFDTPDGRLAAQRCAVRLRRGGPDAGWHLKEKRDGATRELQWPLAEEMPAALRGELADRIGEPAMEVLRPIATLRTERRVRHLENADGVAVIELADDRVDAENRLSGERQRWREWEAELLPGGSAESLDLIEPLLRGKGAEPVEGSSKIQRTMRGPA